MQWIESALYPFREGRWKEALLEPGGVVFCGILFAGTVSCGFLYVVGVQLLSICMAVMPCVMIALILLCLGAGYYWEWVRCAQNPAYKDEIPDRGEWQRYIIEGFQLLIFYGLILTFLTTATLYLFPYSLVLIILLLMFHPILFAPLILGASNKSLSGLLDGCLSAPEFLNEDYLNIWAETTLYMLMMGGLLYPFLTALLGLTVLGAFCLPCLMGVFITGYCRLVSSQLNMSAEPVPDLVAAFSMHPHLPGPSSLFNPHSDKTLPWDRK
jgi:hypothetical protein